MASAPNLKPGQACFDHSHLPLDFLKLANLFERRVELLLGGKLADLRF
jgi:hypothetical protein